MVKSAYSDFYAGCLLNVQRPLGEKQTKEHVNDI